MSNEDDDVSSSDEMNLMTEALFRASDGFRRVISQRLKTIPQ